jgi:hypothetical protein
MDRELISEYMTDQNEDLHTILEEYGTFSGKWAKGINSIKTKYNIESMLDYGAGKQTLKEHFPDIHSYDPGIPAISSLPFPADLVICTHVLEHVEPELLDNVLQHIFELTKKVFLISVNDGPSNKFLPDGRDSNLIQEDMFWWRSVLEDHFSSFDIFNLNRFNFVKNGSLIAKKDNSKGTFLGVKNE